MGSALPSPHRNGAYLAWLQVSPGSPAPTKIDLLKPRHLELRSKSYVFRMHGVGPEGSPIIAKLCRSDTGALERTIYGEVLRNLPTDCLHYYGSVEESGFDALWLFMEDAGEDDIAKPNDGGRILASGWLGEFHAASQALAPLELLPRLDAAHFLTHLRQARAAIQKTSASTFENDARGVLRSVAAKLALIENEWSEIDQAWARIPHAVAHGDFRGKHIKPFTGSRVPRIGVLDWEMAGWGPIAFDVGTIKAHQSDGRINAYLAGASEAWPDVTPRSLTRMGEFGYLFRLIASVDWASTHLQTHYPERGITKMSWYDEDMGESIKHRVWQAW